MPHEVPEYLAAQCRLQIKLARCAPVAVLFRRGPTRWVQLIRWDTANDTFELGQWFHGRIHEAVSGLSDDGELLVYLARKDTRRSMLEIGSETWTALSRPPYLTAMGLWPYSSYCGGGRFTRDGRLQLWLPGGALCGHSRFPFDRLPVLGWDGVVEEAESDRWDWQPLDVQAEQRRIYGWESRASWQKRHPDSVSTLTRLPLQLKQARQAERTVWQGVFCSEHGEHEIEAAEFIDLDQQGRLIAGRGGELWVCDQPAVAQLQWRLLADFSGLKPESKAAPEWATQWPYQSAWQPEHTELNEAGEH